MQPETAGALPDVVMAPFRKAPVNNWQQWVAVPGWLLMLGAVVWGWFLSAELLRVHILTHTIVGFNGTCGGGMLDCSGVAASSLSSVLGIPLPVLGLTWFSVLGVLSALTPVVMWATRKPPAAEAAGASDSPPFTATHWLVTLWALGSAISVGLLLVSVLAVGSLCMLCVKVYLCNFGGLLGAWLATGRGPACALSCTARQIPRVFTHVAPWATLLMVVGGIYGYMVLDQISRDELQNSAYLAAQMEGTVLHNDRLIPADAPSVGPKNAAVTIVVFSDFTCPHCAAVDAHLMTLQRMYPDRIRVVWRNFFGEARRHLAEFSARASICALRESPARFWQMHDKLFTKQIAIVQDDFSVRRQVAESIGLDMKLFDARYGDDVTTGLLNRDLEFAREIGLTHAPTFFINNVWHIGNRDPQLIKFLVESALTRADQASSE